MAETLQSKEYEPAGCGLVGAFFQFGGSKTKKASVAAIPADNNSLNSKRSRGSSGEMMGFLDTSMSSVKPKPPLKMGYNKPSEKQKFVIKKQQERRTTSSLVVNSEYAQRLRREPTFSSSELSVTIHRKSSASGSSLYRASAGSVLLAGHLGNLKQSGNKKSTTHVIKGSSKTLHKEGNGSGNYGTMGNILKKSNNTHSSSNPNNRLDPEELKSIGNEKFRLGNLNEALSLYNQAIALDPDKASFYSNKSAALMGLGRLVEAIFQCLEAIRIEPSYHNAHYRLARLYLRLGEAEKAVHHFKNAGVKASSKDMSQAKDLEEQLGRCIGARKHRDWEKLLSDSRIAVTMGADSAPQIYAMQAEALLKLRRHEEAYIIIQKGPNFDIELFNRFLGSAECANLLMIRSQVYMAIGRFEDAVGAAKNAARIDSSEEVKANLKKVNAVAAARSNGNKLFNESKFPEATVVYSAALEQDPYNSTLLCNRAACRAKLGFFEKAVEDCSSALILRPSYYKARLRRADCNAKLGRWEAALGDYEVLMQEIPGDDMVTSGFMEAKEQVEREHNYGDGKRRRSNSKSVSSKENLKQIITAAEFYGSSSSSNSFKFYGEHGRSLSSLQAIRSH